MFQQFAINVRITYNSIELSIEFELTHYTHYEPFIASAFGFYGTFDENFCRQLEKRS
jgi:hypothetical protein